MDEDNGNKGAKDGSNSEANNSNNQSPSVIDPEGDHLQYVFEAVGGTEDMRQVLMFLTDNGGKDSHHLIYLFGQLSEEEVIDNNGMSPLQRAAKAGNLFVVKWFFNNRETDFKRKDNGGMTALSLAAKYGHLDVVEYLLRFGSDINSLDVNNMSPLLQAVDAEHWGVVRYLVGHGADVNIVDVNGKTALHRVVGSAKWDMVSYLVGMGADVNFPDGNNRYPLKDVVDAKEWELVKYMIEKGAKISCLSSSQKDTLLDVVVGQNDEEFRDFYNVLRLSSVELLDVLIRKKKGDEDTDNPGVVKKIENSLSEAYEILKVRNVPLSTEIEFVVENLIINSRFFVGKEEVKDTRVEDSVEAVNARIEMITDLINELNVKYSGDRGLELGEEFLIMSRFVAQHIRVLKRQLRSTYNKLPWEEIEFCISVFISSRSKGINPNNIYRLILDEDRVLIHLSRFSDEIIKQRSFITAKDINSKFPQKQDKRLSLRSDIVKCVVSNNPLFKDLYKDFKMAKNIYSLQRIESYIKLLLSINIHEKQELGKLAIERALQVIGESLKNTVESPNLSEDVHERLIRTAPQNVRVIISSLRDSLSHSFAFTNKLELEEKNDITIFIKIIKDLEKINVEIGDILNENKVQLLRMYTDKITKSISMEEIKKLGRNFLDIDFGHFVSENSIEVRHLKKLKLLVDDLSNMVEKRTEEENVNFDKIYNILDLELSKIQHGSNKFKIAFRDLQDLSSIIRFSNDVKDIEERSKHIIYVDEIEPEELNNIQQYTTNIVTSYQLRSKTPESQIGIIDLLVAQQLVLKIGKVEGLDELTNELENKEIDNLDNVDSHIKIVFDEVERSLETEQEKSTFRKEIDSKRESLETKKKLKLLLEHLKEEPLSITSVSVTEKYEHLCSSLNLKKSKKQSLDKKFYNSEFEECNKIVDNLRDNYEIFLNSVTNSLERDSRELLPQQFKLFFISLFKYSGLINKLNMKIENIFQENPKQLEHFYNKRLAVLARFISTMSGPDFLQVCKEDKALKAAVEVIVLDLTEVLESVSLFGDNRLFLDQFSPLLIGKSLRNYLAHGDALIDVLPFEPSTTLVSTSLKLIQEGTDLISSENILIGQKITDNFSELGLRYRSKLKQYQIQKHMLLVANIGYISKLKNLIENGADINAKGANGMNGLHFAAAGDNLNTLKFFLDNNVSVSLRNTNGQSILHIAAFYGSHSVNEFLMEQKSIPVDQLDNLNFTPLLYAARFGHADIVEDLLDNGANIEFTDEEGRTALHISSLYGFKDVVMVLLARNANIHATSRSDFTPLHMATYQDHTEVVDILLRSGAQQFSRIVLKEPLLNSLLADGKLKAAKRLLENLENVNEASDTHTTPLHIAAKYNQIMIVQKLLARGAIIDAHDINGWTPLDYAARFKHSEFAKILLENGAKPSSLTLDDRTPLHFAAAAGAKDIVVYLLDKGANVDSLTKKRFTPLMYAACSGHTDVVLELLEMGAKVNEADVNKLRALHFAAFNGHKDVVVALLRGGADVNGYDNEGRTPLLLASLTRKSEIVEVLLDFGADVNFPNTRYKTPLMCAVSKRNAQIVNLLLERGAQVDSSDKNKIAAIHIAAEVGDKDITEILLKNGASIETLTKINWTPLHYASGRGHENVVKYLLESGANVNALANLNLTPLPISGITDTAITPLELALTSCHLGVIKVLVRSGASLGTSTANALHMPIKLGKRRIVDFLFDNGADINSFDRNGNNCLHISSKTGKNDIVDSLLLRGADVDVVNGENRTPLLLAALENHGEVVESLLEKGANVDSIDASKMTALHYAARSGYEDIVAQLLKRGANINAIDGFNLTPLWYATKNSHKSVVYNLLQKGCKVDARNSEGITALHHAVSNGQDDIVKVLLANGAEINAHGEAEATSLHYSAENGHLAITKDLIVFGANIESLDVSGSTPLLHAAGHGYAEIVAALIQAGANVNSENKSRITPLHNAAKNGHKDIVYQLLAKGSNINAVNLNNLAALQFAACNDHGDVVRALLENRANVNLQDASGLSALHQAAKGGFKDVAKSLLEYGSNVHARDNNGMTALHYASHAGYRGVVKVLLDNGADKDCKNNDNWTPLLQASSEGHNDVVTELLEHGAAIEAQLESHQTPLHAAVVNWHLSVVTTLLSKGANVDVSLKNKWTPLHTAASDGNVQIVSALCGNGANLNSRTDANFTPLHIAVLQHHSEIVKALLMFGADVNSVVDNTYFTSLHLAACYGDVEIGEALLAKGASINSQVEGGYSAMHFAAKSGHDEFVKVLWLRGADIDIRDNIMVTPLHLALRYGTKEVVFTLLDKGADFLTKNIYDSSLHRAVESNNVDVIKCIIDKIRDKFEQDPSQINQFLNDKDDDGDTPLMWASEKGLCEAAKLLLESGVETSAQNDSGMTALHWAAQNGHVETVQLLLDNKVNANIKDSNGKTAFEVAWEKSYHVNDEQENYVMISALLMSVMEEENITLPTRVSTTEEDIRSLETLASTAGTSCNQKQHRKKRGIWECTEEDPSQEKFKDADWDDVVRWLVEKKNADINVVNRFGRSILHRSVEKGNLSLVKWLVDKGADINARDKHGTCVLHLAASSGRLDIVKWVVEEKQAQVDDKDKFGRTALHFAALYGYKDVAEYLVSNGVNLDIRDIIQNTAEDSARKVGHTEMVLLLQKANVGAHMQQLNVLKNNLVLLKSEYERLGLEHVSSMCSSIHRRKRRIGSCEDKKHDQVFPYDPLVESEDRDLSHWSRLYTHVAMAIAVEHPSRFVNGNQNAALDLITTYNGYIGDIVSKGTSNQSPRENQLLLQHYEAANKFFQQFPEKTLLREIDNWSTDMVYLKSTQSSWLLLNERDVMTVLNENGRFQIFSSGFNYQYRFQTRDDLTFQDIDGFIKVFFKWRGGNGEYKTFVLVESLSVIAISTLENAPFWEPDKVAPDGILLAKEHEGLVETIPAETVRELFFVDGKSPDLAAIHSNFFKQHQGDISLRLEILHKVLPSLTNEETRALVRVIQKYDFPVNRLYNRNLIPEERSLLEAYQLRVEHELKTATNINLKTLSDLSWSALSDSLGKETEISPELSEKVVSSSKDLHVFATQSAWAKGMATQTMFFLPDMIRATNTGDVSSLAQMGAMISGDSTVNNLYTGLVNNLEEVLPEGRARILRALPVTSPVFKALTVYSIVELTKQLHALPSTSETRSIIEHKLGEQYMTAGLMVAELLGFEVTPLWIGLIAEQLIFDADAFRRQNHLDVSFWEAFLMSLGFEQDFLRTVLEERQLLEMNFSMVNALNRQSGNRYGWVIVKIPKLGDLTWKYISREKLPKEIIRKVNSVKADVSTRTEEIFTCNGFRLVKKYKLNRYLSFSTTQVTRGKLLKSFWQKSNYRADPKYAKIEFSLHYNDAESFKEEDNVFLDETMVDNVFYNRVPSVLGGRFANGMDPVTRKLDGAAVYANNQTYTDAVVQSNFYTGFDPREGDLHLEFTTNGLVKIDDLNTIHNLRTKPSKLYNSHNNSSPFIVTVKVGHKQYPYAIEFSNTTGSFFLVDKSNRVITQYLINSDSSYVIQDESIATRIVLIAQLSEKQKKVNSTCSTISDDGPDSFVVRTFDTDDAGHCTDVVKQIVNKGIMTLLGFRKYLQLFLSGHFIVRNLSVSAERIDIVEAEGLDTNHSAIQLGDEVQSFNITIRGDLVVNSGPTRLQLSGKVPKNSPPFIYYKTSNKMMTFYDFKFNDIRPILNSLTRLNTTLSENNLAIKFNTSDLNCTWHDSSPDTCSLKVTGYLDGKSAVLKVEKEQDVLTVFENETRVATVFVKHYDQRGRLKKGMLLQDVYALGDLDAPSVDSSLNVNHLYKLHGPGEILSFLSPDGYQVNHWFSSGGRIYLNGVGYSINRGHICAVDGTDGGIDGDRIIKCTNISKENRKNGRLKDIFLGVCFKQTLKDSIIAMRNGTMVVNGLSLQRLPEQTKIYFGNFDVFTMKTLVDSLVGRITNNTSAKQNVHKRSASENNFENTYRPFGDHQHFAISLREDQNISKISTNIEYQAGNVSLHDNGLGYTDSNSANTLRIIDDWQIDGLEGVSTLKFDPVEQVVHGEAIIDLDHELRAINNEGRHVHDASPLDVVNGATSLGSSPINKIIAWVRDTSGWFVSRVLDTYRAKPSSEANYKLPLGVLLSDPTLSYSAALSHFHLNETLVLVDFLVRIFTKVKEPRLSSKQTSMNLFEAQIFALKLTSAFDDLLGQISHSLDIPCEEIEFNPVILQSSLVSVITNGDCSSIPYILFESLEERSLTVNENVYNCFRKNVKEVLSSFTLNRLLSSNEFGFDRGETLTHSPREITLEPIHVEVTSKQRYPTVPFTLAHDHFSR